MDLLDEMPQRAQLAGHAGSMTISFFHFNGCKVKVSNKFDGIIPSKSLFKK